MNDDIWFNPGDKVMRVSGNTPGVRLAEYQLDRPKFGKVYCVSRCFRSYSGTRNQVELVGFPPCYGSHGQLVGWPANAFRRIEEIRLCVEALRNVEQPTTLILRP